MRNMLFWRSLVRLCTAAPEIVLRSRGWKTFQLNGSSGRQVRMPHQSLTRCKSRSPFGESGTSISSSLFSCNSFSRMHLRVA
ncbi:hypothetical protein EDB83DRAFT_2408522 [Lactarius deliciosus]|nr:hypothetical protein EDB83DRAFT_2408522 [Lactarius deliciosus]